jgi:hypothetical protein
VKKKATKEKQTQKPTTIMVRLSKKTLEWIKAKGKYGESHDDVLRRELSIK